MLGLICVFVCLLACLFLFSPNSSSYLIFVLFLVAVVVIVVFGVFVLLLFFLFPLSFLCCFPEVVAAVASAEQ